MAVDSQTINKKAMIHYASGKVKIKHYTL